MEPREIDRLVAEHVMGWEEFEDSSGYKWWSLNEDGKTKIIRSVRCFEPSKDIRDAWRLVEKLKIAVIPQSEDAPKDMKYLAEIDNQPFGNYYEAFAETAPMAICLVALKSMGVDIEKGKEPIFVGWDEAMKAAQEGKEVNMHYRGKVIRLNKDSKMSELYREFDLFSVTLHDVLTAKYTIVN